MRWRNLLAAASAAVVTVILGLVANVSAADKYEVIYNIPGLAGGAGPLGGLISDAAGNLYGTASFQGDASFGGNGVVFKLSHDTSGGWRGTVLHTFQGTDGANPNGGLIFDRAGNLYGTTYSGGTHNNGTVFKLSPDPDGKWTETVLHIFQGSPDGANPDAGLIFDRAGNLYGTSFNGGVLSFGGNGTVFELSLEPNGEWSETVLHIFQTTGPPNFQATGGSGPQARLTFDRAGNLYGTTFSGGSPNGGVVFKLSPEPNGRWIETVLHGFQGFPDGAQPIGDLVIDAAGNLYGTTTAGGNSGNCFIGGCGTVFRITP